MLLLRGFLSFLDIFQICCIANATLFLFFQILFLPSMIRERRALFVLLDIVSFSLVKGELVWTSVVDWMLSLRRLTSWIVGKPLVAIRISPKRGCGILYLS